MRLRQKKVSSYTVESDTGIVTAMIDTEWLRIGKDGRCARIRANVGARYLYELLIHPWQRIGSLELHLRYQILIGGEMLDQTGEAISQCHAPGGGTEEPIPMTDKRTVLELMNRLRRIEEELDETEGWNDFGKRDDLLTEKEGIRAYLCETLSSNGRIRNFGSSAGKIRQAVFRSIKRAIVRIAEQDAEIGEYLRHCIELKEPYGYLPGQ